MNLINCIWIFWVLYSSTEEGKIDTCPSETKQTSF